MNLKVIDCHYDGIGDAVLYAWLIHSARAAGRTDCRVNLRRHSEIGYMFGVTPDMATYEPGHRFFTDTGGSSSQTKHEVDNAETVGTRFAAWAEHLGLGKIAPVRPPYTEHPDIAAWADKTWKDRDRDSGKNVRVTILPETYWPNRQWPIGAFVDLANMLANAGCNVITILPTATNKNGWPYQYHGLSLYQGAAMIARSDLVIGPDSGPAHIAGTIGVPTVAVCGPTRPEIVFGHLPSVEGVSLDPVALNCVGCHFRGPKGFRHACEKGCHALNYLRPEYVYARAMAKLSAMVLTPREKAPEEAADAVAV